MILRLIQAAVLLVLGACGTSAQTTGGAAQGAQRPFSIAEVATFDSPWAMDFLPGSGVPMLGSALVTEKAGRLWLVDVKSGRKQEVAGVPRVHVEGQGGLADVVARLESLGRWRVYLSFTEAGPNGTSGAAVGYGHLLLRTGQPRIEGFKVIWRQQPKVEGGNHYSQRIAFAPDGTMFVTSGERFQFDPAQDPNSDLGKVIHMTAEGQRIGGRYYTLGHRTLLGLAFAPDGRLWETEMGPQGGDELNLIVAGRNYGWPKASNGSNYGGGDIPDHRPGDGFEPPKVWWNPSVSPGSLMIYSGALFPQWKGDALIGALSGQALIRVDINGEQARKADQWDMGGRIRAVKQGPRGEVYLLEDGAGGRLLRLEPAQTRR
jgi:glucose/arabinose dehydrogenase